MWIFVGIYFYKFLIQRRFHKILHRISRISHKIGNFLRFVSLYLPRLDKIEKTEQKGEV